MKKFMTSSGVPRSVAKVYYGQFVTAQWARIVAEVNALAPEIDSATHRILQIVPGETTAKSYNKDGFRIDVVPSPNIFKGQRRLRNLLTELNVDVLHSHSWKAALFSAIACMFHPRKIDKIYEVHGAVAFESFARHKNGVTRYPRMVVLYLMETFAALLSNRLILVSREVEKYYPIYKFKPRKAISRSLGAEFEQNIECRDKTLVRFARKTRESGKFLIVYSGSAARWQLPQLTAKTMERLVGTNQANAIILTKDRSQFRSLISINAEIAGSFLVATAAHDEVVAALRLCDVGMLLREDIVLNRVASPTKLYEYIGSGLAVLTTEGVREALSFINSGIASSVSLDDLREDRVDFNELVSRLRSAITRSKSMGPEHVLVDAKISRGLLRQLYRLSSLQ